MSKDDLAVTPLNPSPRKRKIWIFIIFLVVASDSIALSSSAPYMPQMMREKFNIQPQDVGIHVGILQGIYSVANFLSSATIGHLSDKVAAR
jgi:MFS family permease